MKINIVKNKKIVGWIEGDTFYTVRTPEHWFRKFEGFGASASILAELQNRDIENYCVIFRRNVFQERRLKTKVVNFYDYGDVYMDGDDKQFILNIKYFNVSEKKYHEIQEKLYS